jgi:putative transposase
MPACQAACRDRLPQAIPPAHTRPVRGFSQDARRGGGVPLRRRRLTARGGQPVGPVQPVFEWLSGDGAVEPTPGERLFVALPSLNAAMFQGFGARCAEAFPDRLTLLRLENRGAPTAQQRAMPAAVRLVGLPPYGPELNPMARLWRALNDARAWLQFPTREGQQDSIATLLRAYEAAMRQALTHDTSLVEAMHALDT